MKLLLRRFNGWSIGYFLSRFVPRAELPSSCSDAKMARDGVKLLVENNKVDANFWQAFYDERKACIDDINSVRSIWGN